MALMERVHSDGDIPPGRRCFLLMENSKQHFHLPVHIQASHIDHIAADAAVGDCKRFQADIRTFPLVFA
jgi:hypothetical protein